MVALSIGMGILILVLFSEVALGATCSSLIIP